MIQKILVINVSEHSTIRIIKVSDNNVWILEENTQRDPKVPFSLYTTMDSLKLHQGFNANEIKIQELVLYLFVLAAK